MVLIVIRNEEKISPKTQFLLNLVKKQNPEITIITVYRRESQKFIEKWSRETIQLRSSNLSIILSYSLMLLKSPLDFRDGLMFRFFAKKRENTLTGHGLFSTISNILYLLLGSSAQNNNFMSYLSRQGHLCKVFLIDEFVSIKCLNIINLHRLGPIIYVSQDVAHNRFGFGNNSITKQLTFRLERDAVANFDLVVACSQMECLKYLDMGARKASFYPNIYPTDDFKAIDKDQIPSICIVLRGHWGSVAEKSLESVFSALGHINQTIKVYMIGTRPKKIPKNVIIENHGFIPSKTAYLKLLSKSWVGINMGIHMAGTNERKYDYAEAGLVVFSDSAGSRGDLLPYEYAFVDSFDLAAKIVQLLEFGPQKIAEMGKENRRLALLLAEKGRANLLDFVSNMIC